MKKKPFFIFQKTRPIVGEDRFETEEERTERNKIKYRKMIGIKCPKIELGKHRKRDYTGSKYSECRNVLSQKSEKQKELKKKSVTV